MVPQHTVTCSEMALKSSCSYFLPIFSSLFFKGIDKLKVIQRHDKDYRL